MAVVVLGFHHWALVVGFPSHWSIPSSTSPSDCYNGVVLRARVINESLAAANVFFEHFVVITSGNPEDLLLPVTDQSVGPIRSPSRQSVPQSMAEPLIYDHVIYSRDLSSPQYPISSPLNGRMPITSLPLASNSANSEQRHCRIPMT